jgi:hypothetical protein
MCQVSFLEDTVCLQYNQSLLPWQSCSDRISWVTRRESVGANVGELNCSNHRCIFAPQLCDLFRRGLRLVYRWALSVPAYLVPIRVSQVLSKLPPNFRQYIPISWQHQSDLSILFSRQGDGGNVRGILLMIIEPIHREYNSKGRYPT